MIRVIDDPQYVLECRHTPEPAHGLRTLGCGDCRVETRDSLVSYAVSERLEAMLAQLLSMPRSDNGNGGE